MLSGKEKRAGRNHPGRILSACCDGVFTRLSDRDPPPIEYSIAAIFLAKNGQTMTNMNSKIIYTHTDEAPALATYSFLPIIKTFAEACDVTVETRNISLAGRIIAVFPDRLTKEQQIPDALAELGELAKRPEANIIKLPNISASIPQLKAAIAELQKKGYALPDYPGYRNNKECDKALVKELWRVLDSADIAVAHNGDGFDVQPIESAWSLNTVRPASSPRRSYRGKVHVSVTEV